MSYEFAASAIVTFTTKTHDPVSSLNMLAPTQSTTHDQIRGHEKARNYTSNSVIY